MTVRFYSETDAQNCPGKLVEIFNLGKLTGSPDGSNYAFVHDFIIPPEKQFKLPNGKFGYSFEFNNKQTAIELAGGGRGNENLVWENCTGPHSCIDPNIWAGFYLTLYALEGSNNNICIEPIVLNIYNSINKKQSDSTSRHKGDHPDQNIHSFNLKR